MAPPRKSSEGLAGADEPAAAQSPPHKAATAAGSPAGLPTPQRQRAHGGGESGRAALRSSPTKSFESVDAATADHAASRAEAAVSSTPAEAFGLPRPSAFCEAPRGERLTLAEGGALATRSSGVGHGVAFVGPLQFDRGAAYFEIEVTQMEAKGSQTIALGVCSALPAASSTLRAERARDLGEGSWVLGYDLPKVYAHGAEASKINTRLWRPLKEVAIGDRIGLLVERASMELTVFANGVRKASAAVLGAGGRQDKWPAEVWGIVDVHGKVSGVRLHDAAPAAPTRQLSLAPTRVFEAEAAPATPREPAAAAAGAAAVEASAAAPAEPAVVGAPDDEGPQPAATAPSTSPGKRAAPMAAASGEAAPGPKKRLRLSRHPCGCMVHLVQPSGDVVHVPPEGDFVIGRNPKCCNLTLDSEKVPNMVSRRHAVIVSADDAVMAVDCESVNGTFVNGRRVGRETLRQGDTLTVGQPGLCPPEFEFSVSMPPSASTERAAA